MKRIEIVLMAFTKSQSAPSLVQIVAMIAEPITAMVTANVPRNSATAFRMAER